MDIQRIIKDRLMNISSAEQSLKTGQVLKGKILKIYPNNKAQIQLGTQTMVAQLELALAVGEQYHFQVESSEDIVHLKVIGEPLKGQAEQNITGLLREMELKVNQMNVNFARDLIELKIPFQRNDLSKSFSLLDNTKNKVQAQEVLKEMIIQKRPITDLTFQALLSKSTTTLSEEMKQMIKHLRLLESPTHLEQSLLKKLTQLSERPLTNQNNLVSQLLEEVITNHAFTFNTLKATGLIEETIDFSDWKSQLKGLARQSNIHLPETFNHQSQSVNNFASNEQLAMLQTKLPVQIEMVERVLQHMQNTENSLRTESQIIVNKWSNLISETVIQNRSLSDQSFTLMNQEITEKILPLLTTEQQNIVKQQLKNNPDQLRKLLTTLQTYANKQTYINIDHILTNSSRENLLSVTAPQEQFLSQIRDMHSLLGLTHENSLMQDVSEQNIQTIKSMLIQMVQQGEGAKSEHPQQLLHFINGLQLQSVNEMGSFIQASMQIPGEKLSLNNDLYIDFESKKTADGKINPDFCRILFYLDLKSLEETIIDMQVQKRLVSVTIFNDHQQMKMQSLVLQPMLKKGLESIDYQLSNIMVKPLQESNHTQKKSVKQTFQNTYEGIEFRI